MPQLDEIVAFLKEFAPLALAEEWDNVGLLVGDRQQNVDRVLTCLTLSPDVAAEAVSRHVGLVVSHHPILFRPVQRLTDDTTEGKVLLNLIGARIAVYSPHTAFDSAADGINQQLANALGLTDIGVLRVNSPPECADGEDNGSGSASAQSPAATPLGSGRFGRLPQPELLVEFNERVKRSLGISHLQYVGDDRTTIRRVAVACGSAAEFLPDARRQDCDVLLTGEARFHACLEAKSSGIAMVLAGHYATERPAVEQLANRIAARFPGLDCFASQSERDPVRWSIS